MNLFNLKNSELRALQETTGTPGWLVLVDLLNADIDSVHIRLETSGPDHQEDADRGRILMCREMLKLRADAAAIIREKKVVDRANDNAV